ncbi:hypothetical protein H2199_009050 [Coniosporium tulheliwenetii]|uniref:Uncharacterized protein n=1 Tax=Coniosporium tulheliwenetii TaxID=3383036 RepID=A0ACC2YFP8_9PEZI|nr:hypothetical protein H2199_009050 [Cladosporium sp. JES 115]
MPPTLRERSRRTGTEQSGQDISAGRVPQYGDTQRDGIARGGWSGGEFGSAGRDNRQSKAAGRGGRRRHGGGRGGAGRDKRAFTSDEGVDEVVEGFSPRELGAEELSEAPSVPHSAPDLDSHSAADTSGTKTSRITARSAHFEDYVLGPRRITINGKGAIDANPFRYFGTEAAPHGETIDYSALKGLDAAQVWLSIDERSITGIIEEYAVMTYKNVCEEEYASFATETFLKRQRRFLQVPSDRKWRAERMLQLVAPPKRDAYWDPPICFATDPNGYRFDSRPDCSYWLSLAGFNSDYRSELGGAVYVHNDWITCPYFTIEFKKHHQSDLQARAQAAAAGSLALYNRYMLKSTALKDSAREWTEADKALIRHYALTFVGADFQFWVLQPRLLRTCGSWDGCTMRKLYDSKCTSNYGVRQLERWINEIHRWGLTKHASSCQEDIKTILEVRGVDTSAINFD